ncbi:MAG TPA: hydroxymethylglutaryl-CoA lyase [Caulobacterales bacterium]|nr:hydroxymethylglutaryl-CoA lyase [Caulobacterales bacterium]
MPRPIEIVEVSPRDGLQNEKVEISTAQKVELIGRAIAAGARRIEATSFVSPRAVPQMADAAEVMARLRGAGDLRAQGVTLIGLALNKRGFERALMSDVDEVNFVVGATESFNRRNQNAAIAQTMADFAAVMEVAKAERVRAGLTISVAFGCPFEGEVSQDAVAALAREAGASGAAEIALGDTIGVADPLAVEALMAKAAAAAPGVPLRLHFHNTRNTGIANAFAAWRAGAATLDASIAGLGGCPFAPRATGNIATEDLVYMLGRMGVETGYDLAALIASAAWIETVGLKPASMVARAGGFPVPEQ